MVTWQRQSLVIDPSRLVHGPPCPVWAVRQFGRITVEPGTEGQTRHGRPGGTGRAGQAGWDSRLLSLLGETL